MGATIGAGLYYYYSQSSRTKLEPHIAQAPPVTVTTPSTIQVDQPGLEVVDDHQ
jgi:hypothetical protein